MEGVNSGFDSQFQVRRFFEAVPFGIVASALQAIQRRPPALPPAGEAKRCHKPARTGNGDQSTYKMW